MKVRTGMRPGANESELPANRSLMFSEQKDLSNMARHLDQIPSERVYIAGRRKRGISTREDKTFAWLDEIPSGQRFAFVWELLTSALNGELGPMMQTAVQESDVDKAKVAAAQISAAFVIDDD